MSLKKNILAGYATQLYVTLVGILILPLYLKNMGAEAYGLVGFFTMLQAWFNLLDIGLTPTVARETARFQGGATDALSYCRLIRALQIIFFSVALLGGGAIFLSSGLIADKWLNAQKLPMAQVQIALQLMAMGIALRWMSGLYRGCIAGAERLVWLGGFNAFVATLRFIGVLPILIWFGHSPAIFFSYQLLVAIIELAGLAAKAHGLVPVLASGQAIGWTPSKLLAPIKRVLKFSMSIAFTSSVWVLVTQTDKLLLSKLLPLADYGYFTLAVLAASGVMMVSGPISAALMPRMARLHAENEEASLTALYRNATQLIAVTAISVCLTLAFFAKQLLWVWTGDPQASTEAAYVLRLYALGNGFLVMASFPYYLQFAKGNLRLHLIGNAVFVLTLVPSIIWATLNYGAVGAGYTWLAMNAFFFFAWVPVVHKYIFSAKHSQWLWNDIFPIVLPGLAASYILHLFFPLPEGRVNLLITLSVYGATIFLASAAGSSQMRAFILRVKAGRLQKHRS